MDNNDKIKLIDDLITQAEKMGSEDISTMHSRTKMIIRKVFDDNSHYLKDVDNISYSPPFFTTDSPDSYFNKFFDSGKKELVNLLKIMKEDIELS